ncbi:MAG: hypothetical protein JSS78_03015 [Bacteroidetes bacterium]|nr:hypothetical protein [Bacteroidota bacterium]
MLSHVTAQIELDGENIGLFTTIQLFQEFNAHHQLTITVPFNAMEQRTSIDIINTQNKIGKSVVLRLKHASSGNDLLVFRGILGEVNYELGDNYHRNLLLQCYSPTILLETGNDYRSFLDQDLKTVVDKVFKPVKDFGVTVDLQGCDCSSPTPYLCQYNESSFNFLNRLSIDFISPFFYDGVKLFFGNYEVANVELVYGVDIDYFKIAYKVIPLKFSKYVYNWLENSVHREDAPTTLDSANWSTISKTLFDRSHNLFTTSVQSPLLQVIDKESDLADFVKIEEAQRSTQIKTITGRSVDTDLQLGRKITVKIPVVGADGRTTLQEQGSYFITSVKHFVSETGQYYNVFEGVTAEVGRIPLPHNVAFPKVNTEWAIVKFNKDPDNKGRVVVQTSWQARNNETTNWIKVLTPDAGEGKDGAGNRGLVVIPEEGDLVIVCYKYNDPNRPFVMGSMFTGKTGGGGGAGNKTKSLTALSGATLTINGTVITINNAGGASIVLDQTKIDITANAEVTVKADSKITLNVGGSTLSVKPSAIELVAPHIYINGTSDVNMFSAAGQTFIAGDDITVQGTNTLVKATAQTHVVGPKVEVKADATAELSAGGPVTVKGAIVNVNC